MITRGVRVWRGMLALALLLGVMLALRPLAPGQGPENWFPGADKLHHVWFFAALWCLASLGRITPVALRAMGLVGFGIGLEVAQGLFTDTRGMSVADVLADVAGLGLGALVFRWASGRQPQEHRG